MEKFLYRSFIERVNTKAIKGFCWICDYSPFFKNIQNLLFKRVGEQFPFNNKQCCCHNFIFFAFSSTSLASFSLNALSFACNLLLPTAIICAAHIPAFFAPALPMAIVATGTPAGI